MVLWLSHARWHLLCHSNIVFYISRLFYYISVENNFFLNIILIYFYIKNIFKNIPLTVKYHVIFWQFWLWFTVVSFPRGPKPLFFFSLKWRFFGLCIWSTSAPQLDTDGALWNLKMVNDIVFIDNNG